MVLYIHKKKHKNNTKEKEKMSMKIGESIEALLAQFETKQPQDTIQQNRTNDIIRMPQSTPLKKSVKDADLEQALGSRPKDAVDTLIAKSPIGMKLPSSAELKDYGYLTQCMDMNGNTYYNNGLVVHTHAGNEVKGAYYKAVYTTDRLEQTMYYDKDGNLVEGKFKIKDKTLPTLVEGQFSVWKNDKGGYNYIN